MALAAGSGLESPPLGSFASTTDVLQLDLCSLLLNDNSGPPADGGLFGRVPTPLPSSLFSACGAGNDPFAMTPSVLLVPSEPGGAAAPMTDPLFAAALATSAAALPLPKISVSFEGTTSAPDEADATAAAAASVSARVSRAGGGVRLGVRRGPRSGAVRSRDHPVRAYRRAIAEDKRHWLYAVAVDIDGRGDGGEWRLRGATDIPLQHLMELMCHDQVAVAYSPTAAPAAAAAAAAEPAALLCCGMGWVRSADGAVAYCENAPDLRASEGGVRACRECRSGIGAVMDHVRALVCNADGVFVYSQAQMQRAIDYVVAAACSYAFTRRALLYPVRERGKRARDPKPVCFVDAVAALRRQTERIDVDASIAGAASPLRWVVAGRANEQ